MASYEDKQTKKYMEYHDGIYFGIGCVLGTLCHTLFTFRWGEIHYIMFFAAILATIYASTQFICSLQRQKDRRVWYILYSSWYCIDNSRYLQNTLILKIPQQFCHYKGAEVLFTHSQFIFQDHVWNGNRNRKRVLMTVA